jgi:hypothetical protein
MKAKALLVLVLVLLTCVPASAVQRKVLVEDFTNWSCPPCEAIEDSMDVILTEYLNAGKVVPVRPHVWWPASNDIMWLGDQPDVTARVNYYGVTGVPTFQYDGTGRTVGIFGSPPYASWCAQQRAKIDAAYALPASINITFNYVWRDSVARMVHVDFTVDYAESTQAIGATQQVYMGAVETDHRYATPPGFEREWYIFRGFGEESGTGGAPLAFANVGDSQSYQWTFAYNDTADAGTGSPGSEENPTKLNVVVWVQKNGASWPQRPVLQAAWAPVVNTSPMVDVAPGTGSRFELAQNEPNPFRSQSRIRYALDRRGDVKLAVYDLSGRLVNELVNGSRPEGNHEVFWNGLDRNGKPVGSGVYYYRLETSSKSQTRKMTLVR